MDSSSKEDSGYGIKPTKQTLYSKKTVKVDIQAGSNEQVGNMKNPNSINTQNRSGTGGNQVRNAKMLHTKATRESGKDKEQRRGLNTQVGTQQVIVEAENPQGAKPTCDQTEQTFKNKT